MEKLSLGIPGLDWDYVMDKIKRFGLPSLAVGSGAAGLAHLMSLQEKARKDKEKITDEDTIIIEVPAKEAEEGADAAAQAAQQSGGIIEGIKKIPQKIVDVMTGGPTANQYFWDAPTIAASVAGGGTLGYVLVDSILKKHRERQLEDDLKSLKKQYSGYLAKGMKTANEFSKLDEFVSSIVDRLKDHPVEDSRKEAAYNILKTADPNQNGQEPETMGTLLFSLPGVAALLSGVLAHNYYYNRLENTQRGLEKEEADKMKLAPKNIKIVTVPPNKINAPSKPGQKSEQIPVDDLLGKSAAQAIDAEKLMSMTSEVPAAKELIDQGSPKEEHSDGNSRSDRRKQKILSEEDLQQIDPNTLMLLTDSGNIQVDALDPGALKILQKHKDLILKSFALGMNTR